MPDAGRLGDKAQVDGDTHTCQACGHTAVGPSILGSFTVKINSRPALIADMFTMGVVAPCCAGGLWFASKGSPTVFINGKPAHRKDDEIDHMGKKGKLIEGSSDVKMDTGASSAGLQGSKMTSAGTAT